MLIKFPTKKQIDILARGLIIFSLVYFSANIALANKESKCLNNLANKMKLNSNKIIRVLMTCNNSLLLGQNIYLSTNKQATSIIRTRFPSSNIETNTIVSIEEKVEKLLELVQCEEISRNIKIYMKACEGIKND